ncbi:uncharacterized protein LAJ45_10693 [Morchella importuna]|uniref:uncharacterized protein n=1 Tax=Morchella importuna TaxID=1174673 RepID=UPI001E8E14D3|nr:uncharacterized protein LAJ45_10693 [Morchella importuna]KAH8145256.1 hypothetical protein LAJ45_10693 [Morchella importuna]
MFLIRALRFRPMVIQVGEYRGLTPLELAAKYDHVEIAEYLIAHGAENSVKICRYCLTKRPLQIALNNGSLKALVSTKPLSLLQFLENGLHNGLGNETTKTLLQSAVKLGLVEPVRLMLEYGVNVDEKGKFRDTTPQESCKRHAITAMLLEAGADVSVRMAYGQTPLQMVMCRGNVELVRMLLVRARPKMHIMCRTPVRARKDRGRMAGRVECKRILDEAGVITDEEECRRSLRIALGRSVI